MAQALAWLGRGSAPGALGSASLVPVWASMAQEWGWPESAWAVKVLGWG